MKGMVFVELLDMADSLLGEDVVDKVLNEVDLSTGGAYSAVGNYPCIELMALIQAFSSHSGASVTDLQIRFGRWMWNRFVRSYPDFLADKRDAFAMLEAIEGEVHVEVLKLYPDAELPKFDTERLDDGLRMVYSSPRPLMAFCQGLIEACLDHFGQKENITLRNLSTERCTIAEFTIRTAV
ncbi:MAG: heme NO-binding domain-containing protein [Paracoccaceae bacterium]